MKQETLEMAAFESSVNYKPFEYDLEPHNYYQYGFEQGAKWQAERMYSDMQEYAEFCIECDRASLNPIIAKDWFEQFKKK